MRAANAGRIFHSLVKGKAWYILETGCVLMNLMRTSIPDSDTDFKTGHEKFFFKFYWRQNYLFCMPSVVFCVRLCVALHILGSCRNITWLTAHCNVCSFCTWWKKVRTHSIWKRWHFVGSYRLRTRISFSSESSLPLRAFLSITLIANSRPGCSLLSANRTCEKAPLKKKQKGKD